MAWRVAVEYCFFKWSGDPRDLHSFPARRSSVLRTLTCLVDRTYDPSDELGVAWDDPAVGADWGVTRPMLSERDLANRARADLADDFRPVYGER